jgi:peptidoglycan/LPS O-acetylase OafA/YrhL
MIAAFHGICWVVIVIRDQERHVMFGSWAAASMYVVVDLFLVLTGFLAMRSAIGSKQRGRAVSPSVCAWMGLDLGSMRGKFWRLMPPYVTTMIGAMILFAGDRTWPSMYTRSEWSQRIGQLFGPGNDWQGASLGSAGANLLHLNSLVPYAGFLIHTWSLAIQYVWLLVVPSGVLAAHAAKPTARGALSVALWSAAATAVMRGVMWTKLSTFGGATDLSGYVHFSFYCALGARLLPLMLGAAIAILLADPEGWKAVRASLVGAAWQGWAVRVSMLLCCIGTFAGNTFWEYVFGHPEEHSGVHQLLFYVVFKPGGVASSLVFAWLVLVAVGNLPLLLHAPADAASATKQTWFVAALSHPVWKQPSRASYWLYLVHPVVFAATFAVPHLLMPASQLRLPVPLGYGLAIPRAALTLENASHPLSPWSCPSVQATCDPSAQRAFLPREQEHWLLHHAAETGLAQADALTGVQLAVSAWGSVVIGLVISFSLAYGLEAFVERPASKWLKSSWRAFPAVAGAVDWLVDWYNAWLFATLPLCHAVMHLVWLFAIDPTQETAMLDNLKAGIANSSQMAMDARMAEELQAWGARVATA